MAAAPPSTSSPGATRTAGCPRCKRLSPPAARPDGVLIFDASAPCDLDALHAQALELILRRVGVRTLTLDTGRSTRPRSGARSGAVRRGAVVLTGRRVTLDRSAGSSTRSADRSSTSRSSTSGAPFPTPGASTLSLTALGGAPDSTARGTASCAGAPPAGTRPRLRDGARDERRRSTRWSRSAGAGLTRAATTAVRPALAPRIGRPWPARTAPSTQRASFPELEEQVLERWRERDVFADRSAGARAPRRGASTRARRPPTAARAPTTCWRACSRTSSRATGRCAATTSSARAAGTATGCRSSSRSRRSSASSPRPTSRRYGIAEFNARCREKVLSHVEDWNRLTERIGFWVDLDDAYRTLDTDYVESVLVGAEDDPRARGCCTRSSRSSPTARAAGRRSRATSSGSRASTRT